MKICFFCGLFLSNLNLFLYEMFLMKICFEVEVFGNGFMKFDILLLVVILNFFLNFCFLERDYYVKVRR